MLSVNRAQECSGHPLPVCIASLQISRWRAFSRRTRPCHTSRRPSRGCTRHGPHVALHFRILRAIMFPDAAQRPVAFALPSPLRFGCRSRDLSALVTKHEGAGDGKIQFAPGAFPASSCIRLRALPRAVTRCRGRGRLCTQPCFASAAQCALVSSAPLLSSSPFVGCRALHSCVWRGSLLKSWEPTAA